MTPDSLLNPITRKWKRFISRKFMLAAATPLIYGVSVTASATPSVSGNIISWPDNGWYQVQNASTFESLCEGGRECNVPEGTYIVINHTLGERFENVQVIGASSGEMSPDNSANTVSVDGNVISWPDDGWYQVQNATSFQTVCEGGRSCTVANGTYIVINHDTGARFENISVPAQSDNDSPTTVDTASGSTIVVSGNTISWPSGDWYQVQNASTFDALCEGGISCDVPGGTYNVINLTTGQRFESIVVTGGKTEVAQGSDSVADEETPPSIDTQPQTPPEQQPGTVSTNDFLYLSSNDGFNTSEVGIENFYRSRANYFGDLDGNGSLDYYFHEGERFGCSDLVLQLTSGPSERGRSSPAQVRIGAHFSYDDTCNTPEIIDASTDMNGDGSIDVIVGGFERIVDENNFSSFQNYIALFYGPFLSDTYLVNELNGENGFAIRDVVRFREARSVGDVTGNGIGDLIIEHSGFFELAEPTLVEGSVPGVASVDAYEYVLENELGRESANFNGYLNRPLLGDVDGDGNLDDYVIENCSGHIIYGNGEAIPDSYDFSALAAAGRLTRIDLRFGSCTTDDSRRITDVDGDGLADSVVARSLLLSSQGSRLADAHFLDLTAATGLEFANTLDTLLGRSEFNTRAFAFPAFARPWPATWSNGSLYLNVFNQESGDIELQRWGHECGPQDLVVRQGPDEWEIRWQPPACETSVERYELTINNNETFVIDATQQQFTTTGEALVDGGTVQIASVTTGGILNASPARSLEAWSSPTFLETEMEVNVWSSSLIEVDMGFAPGFTFTRFLIHRDNNVVSAPPAGQQSYQDEDIEPNTTYTYWQSVNNYNFDLNSDISILNRFPRVQWRGNKVTVTTPEL